MCCNVQFFTLYCIYECDGELPGYILLVVNSVLISEPIYFKLGQNCPDLLYIHMCKNSAAMTGSGAGCGSGNYFFYFHVRYILFRYRRAGRIAVLGPYVNLLSSPMQSRCAEQKI
jgi:hypothetical protein